MESTKTRILKKLLETDGYLSGQELCEQLGVSRTAVWKYMKQLKEEGYEIEAIQNKGYCLKDVPDVLGESEIKSRLHTRWAGQTLYYYDEIDSTNTQIKRLAEEDAPHGTLAVADYQSRGKGRRGRAWDSPHGSAIYMSILFRPEIRPDRASMLTLVIGLSVTQAIRSNLGLQAQIKWPNDVVLNGKKLVGILTEMSAQMNYIEYLVTGIGINANLREFPEELEDKATSLQKEIGHKVNRSALIAECMEKIEENYEIKIILPNKYRKIGNKQILKMSINKMYEQIVKKEIDNIMEKIRLMLGIAPEDYFIEQLDGEIAKCTSKKEIIISPEIIQFKRETIEYVIAHEFCHLKYKTHCKSFNDIMEENFENYIKIESELSGYKF